MIVWIAIIFVVLMWLMKWLFAGFTDLTDQYSVEDEVIVIINKNGSNKKKVIRNTK